MSAKCKIVRRKRSKRKILFVVLFVIATIIISAFLFIRSNVNPILLAISNEKVKSLAGTAVSESVLEIMSTNTDAEYLSVTRDADNNITAVEADVELVNSLAHQITLLAQKKINEIGVDGICVPIGSLSGMTLFTGMGPEIKIKIYLVGSTKTRIISEFIDSGVNQTLHRLYLNISGSVAVAVPGLPSTIDVSTQVLMSEMIIVGDVPTTYLKSTSMGDLLDLATS